MLQLVMVLEEVFISSRALQTSDPGLQLRDLDRPALLLLRAKRLRVQSLGE